MPMFPDSGVPPSSALNSLPDVNTAVPASELWYSTSRCNPRFDPAAANAMLSEQMNLIMKAGLQYDNSTLTHVERAVRYIAQKGLTSGATLFGGPFDYTAALDPVMLGYNDYMTLTMIPAASNQGAVRINIDGRGWVALLRNDGQQLQSMDLRASIPVVIAYYAGNWYHVGLCASQVPLLINGAVDIWIRTDGSDATGDGSANTPDKAFATIQGAWSKMGGRYATTPLLVMNFRLGIPGTYVGAQLGPFGSSWNLFGDVNNRGAYRLSSIHVGNNIYSNLYLGSMNGAVYGVTFVRDIAQGNACDTVLVDEGNIQFVDCDWDSTAANTGSCFIMVRNGSSGTMNGNYNFNGRSLAIGSLVRVTGGYWAGCNSGARATYWVNDCPFASSGWTAMDLGVLNCNSLTVMQTNSTGLHYESIANSMINLRGTAPLGDQPGVTGSGGQVSN
jgi:hypothetical protein